MKEQDFGYRIEGDGYAIEYSAEQKEYLALCDQAIAAAKDMHACVNKITKQIEGRDGL